MCFCRIFLSKAMRLHNLEILESEGIMRKKTKIYLWFCFAITMLTLLSCCLVSYAEVRCNHADTTTTVDPPTCQKLGHVYHICDECGATVHTEEITQPHEWINEVVIQQPHLNELGVKEHTCALCGEAEQFTFECEHPEISNIVKEATCTEDGLKKTICSVCENVIGEEILVKTGHSYGGWKIVREASPGVSGLKRKSCACGDFIEESYEFSMAGATSIYIPGTGINQTMNFGGYDQASVDAYNIVYVPQDEPWISGHKGRGLGNIYKAKVGQKMYLSINGVVSEYEIFVSEYATVDETGTFITGHTTGSCVQSLFGYGVLHIYTCYGSGNGRWIVLARPV